MSEPTPVIATSALFKRFSDIDAVAGIDLRVPAGGVYGFLGPNGSGKTTTIRMLVGLLRPTRGSASLFGEPVAPGRPVLDRVGALAELVRDGQQECVRMSHRASSHRTPADPGAPSGGPPGHSRRKLPGTRRERAVG